MYYVIAFYDPKTALCLYKEEDMFNCESAAEKCAAAMFGGVGNMVTLWQDTPEETTGVVTIVQMA